VEWSEEEAEWSEEEAELVMKVFHYLADSFGT
jgi:hypothetical protein